MGNGRFFDGSGGKMERNGRKRLKTGEKWSKNGQFFLRRFRVGKGVFLGCFWGVFDEKWRKTDEK
jgi:hypothetical protein